MYAPSGTSCKQDIGLSMRVQSEHSFRSRISVALCIAAHLCISLAQLSCIGNRPQQLRNHMIGVRYRPTRYGLNDVLKLEPK